MFENYRGLLNEVCIRYPMLGQAMIHHRNTRGQAMSFQKMPYLVPLYHELPQMEGADFRKAVQTGLSELFICLALYHAGWEGKIVAYILPTFAVRDRFVSQRINRVLLHSKRYSELLPRANKNSRPGLGNNKVKQFGSGTLMFLGSNTQVDFVEFSADTLIIDEFDQCDPSNLAKAKDRLRASDDPRLYRLGNPTLPNIGVCKLYDESDQRDWFTKCPRCNEWQALDWFVNFVMKNDKGDWVPRSNPEIQLSKGMGQRGEIDFESISVLPQCLKCHENFQIHGTGEWIAQYPSKTRAGYSISRLNVIGENCNDLYREWLLAQGDLNRLSSFYTSVLGRGFEYSGARINAEMIYACAEEKDELDYGGGDTYRNEIVSMGIDVGSALNVVLSISKEREGKAIRDTVLVCAVRSFDELKDIMIRFHVDCCVIDSMPETRKAQELRDWAIHEGIVVWLCRFHPTSRVSGETYGRRLNWRSKICTVDRTQVFDATFDEIRNKERTLPGDIFTVLGFYDQMKAPVRVLDQERSRIIWTEGSHPDHYRCADIYDRIAFDLTTMGGTYGTM